MLPMVVIYQKENLQTSALTVVTLDTLAAILAGLAIFPAVLLLV